MRVLGKQILLVNNLNLFPLLHGLNSSPDDHIYYYKHVGALLTDKKFIVSDTKQREEKMIHRTDNNLSLRQETTGYSARGVQGNCTGQRDKP